MSANTVSIAKRVSLIGAPTDIGAGTRGASMGPEALRVAHLQSMLESQGVEVLDRGNLQGPGNPNRPPVNGYRHLAEVIAWNRAVHDGVLRRPARHRRLPILLGGDHFSRHRLDQRGGSPLPRARPPAARAVVRRARGFEYQ